TLRLGSDGATSRTPSSPVAVISRHPTRLVRYRLLIATVVGALSAAGAVNAHVRRLVDRPPAPAAYSKPAPATVQRRASRPARTSSAPATSWQAAAAYPARSGSLTVPSRSASTS